MQSCFAWRAFFAACCLLPAGAIAGDAEDADISEITITAKRVAIVQPAGSYESAVTALRFDPLTELQSRGLAEGQSDVAVRGGVFENTGFTVGAVTIMDPQTGHYAAELPIETTMRYQDGKTATLRTNIIIRAMKPADAYQDLLKKKGFWAQLKGGI